ncbi:MAG: penicillin acylase family protein [Acidobacteriaceae bacterium]
MNTTTFARNIPEPYPQRNPPSKWLKAVLSGLLLLVVLAVLLVFGGRLWLRHAMRTSLPQMDGSLHVAGLSAPVTVLRDQHGVPHLRAANPDDLFFAQGYVTAQDRLWQMDMLRRHGAGELAEILGKGMLQHDRMQRYLQLRVAADNAVAHMPADELHWLQDYARGVNAFIRTHPDDLPAEFRLLHYSPAPWLPRDSVLIGLVMEQDLTTEFPTKLARETIAAKLSPEQMGDLYPVGSWRDHPPTRPAVDLTAPQVIPDIPLDSSQTELDLREQDIEHLRHTLQLDSSLFSCDGCLAGSNDWVVSGAHTVTGKPLLSNDMHLGHNIPGIWYMADLEAGTFHVAGVTLPGVPFVIVGHNNRIAWGFTNLGADVQDIYVEQTDGKGDYKAADGWHPMHHDREVIHVRGGLDQTIDVETTDHGPVITPLLPHEKRSLSLQWTIYDPSTVHIPYYAVDAAQNWTEFCTAISSFGGPSQNAVYADVDGNIGYHAVGKVPLRTNGLSPTPIIDEQHEWKGYIPFDQMPQIYNPPDGILATANARVTTKDYPYPITLDWAPPYRNERIWKVLQKKAQRGDLLTPEDMLALQTDVYSDLDHELAQRFAYAIDHTPNASARLRQAANLLRIWDGEVKKNSAAATIVDATRKALWPMLLKPYLGKDWKLYTWDSSSYALEEIVMFTPNRWLPKSYADWNAFLSAAVEKGLQDGHAPDNLTQWKYGQVHPVEIEHPLYSKLPFFKSWTGTGVQPQSGDGTTVKQVGRTFGPSERFTADFSNFDHSTLNIVIGESGDPLSPWYRDQWPYWYGGTTFTLPFSDSAVQAAAQHTLTLLP